MDACVSVAAAPQQLMQALPALGTMISLRGERGGGPAESCATVVGSSGGDRRGERTWRHRDLPERGWVAELAATWQERGRKTKQLRVSHAFHSPRIDGMLEEFSRVVEGVSFAPPTIPVVWNLVARWWAPSSCARRSTRCGTCVNRWLHGRNTRAGRAGRAELVRAGARRDAQRDEPRVSGRCCDQPVVAVPALRRGHPEAAVLMRSLAELWVRGMEVDWESVFAALVRGGWGCPSMRFSVSGFGWSPRRGCGRRHGRGVVGGWSSVARRGGQLGR